MASVKSLEASNTFSVAANQIKSGDFFFFMRTKEQQEYHPDNVGGFVEERYRYAYIIQDMASLVSSNEISHFLSNVAWKLRSGKSHEISREQLDLVKTFIAKGKKQYRKSKYVPLDSLVGNSA